MLDRISVLKSKNLKPDFQYVEIVVCVGKDKVTILKMRTIFTRGDVCDNRLNTSAKPKLPSRFSGLC